jgi:hypothetical protein
MRRLYFILILLCYCLGAHAQIQEGLLLDRESLNPIPGVTVVNTRTSATMVSDSDGHYEIRANSGDTILFRHMSYLLYEDVMIYTMDTRHKTILMQPFMHTLAATVIKGYTQYQLDSIANRDTYDHELHKTIAPTPKYTGLGCSGCFGWLADKITGNSKEDKRFRKEFNAEEQTAYTDSRYTPELVATLTPLKNPDSIAAFIYHYPMDNDFARNATDLELKSWIRRNYKQYTQQANPPSLLKGK